MFCNNVQKIAFLYKIGRLELSDCNKVSKRILKSELVKRGISNGKLVEILNSNGFKETKSSIDSKISRGSFSAEFFLKCLYFIDCEYLDIKSINIKEGVQKL